MVQYLFTCETVLTILDIMDKILEKARKELGEDEQLKNEKLKEFKIWLSNHPFIKSCRNDDTFLLQFLRIRKYNIENTFISFEKFFIFRQKYTKWLILSNNEMEKVWMLFDSGYAYPLIDRDDEGKKIILIQVRKFDTKVFNSCDAIRLLVLIASTLMEEEETQIAGISSISDYTDVSYRYFNLFSLKDIREFAHCAKHATIGREKENYFVNLPTFASFLFDVGKRALNEKLRNRLISTKDMNELVGKHVDVSILPKEYGGKIPEKDMLKQFKESFNIHKKSLEKISLCEIDWKASGVKF